MVNRDSDLYRAHPDWILAAGPREPLLERDQLVLDLTRDEVRNHLFDQISAVLSDNRIGYVKWDHNRELLEAGSGLTSGAPAVHQQTLGFYRLLDDLRERHPGVQWETCASGGGRIDLGVLDRAERVWTSDMTDALARQSIQRWTGQLVPPERLGAHVSAPTSHQTHRWLSLDFRAATALFGALGIEWDITRATEDDPTGCRSGFRCSSGSSRCYTPAASSASTRPILRYRSTE
jgi:alpha-galactosidase